MKANLMLKGPFAPLEAVYTPCERPGRSGLLVMAHGFRGSMEGGGYAAAMAKGLAAFCQVLRFNFSDCQLLSKQVLELEAVLVEAKRRWQPSQLFVLGRSLGGATALAVAGAGRVKVDGLVLWSTPHDLPRTFQAVLGSAQYRTLLAGKDLPVQDEKGALVVQAAFVQDMLSYDLDRCARAWGPGPVLVIHGTSDALVSPEQAQANYEALTGPKQLIYLEGGDHCFTNAGSEAAKQVLIWLQGYLS